jgi:hypothetical protein
MAQLLARTILWLRRLRRVSKILLPIPMEWREKILKLSLEEKEKMDREEEDHIKEAIELGMVDASRW